jgi:hypothetical protein
MADTSPTAEAPWRTAIAASSAELMQQILIRVMDVSLRSTQSTMFRRQWPIPFRRLSGTAKHRLYAGQGYKRAYSSSFSYNGPP